ncbi:MAG: A24 family peptidase [Candidatus Omnitrophota bacterium]
MPQSLIKIIIFLFGSLIGSFLNVCIYRMPKMKRIIPDELKLILKDDLAVNKVWKNLMDNKYIDEDGNIGKIFTDFKESDKFKIEGCPQDKKEQIYKIMKASCKISVNDPPRSFCPYCQKPILWYDNIPFVSYIFLGGKCRFCKKTIPFRYFLVEFITAVLLVILYNFFGLTSHFFIYGALTCALIAATFIDFDFQIIPDEITLGGLVLGILFSIIFPQLHNASSSINSLIQSILGILVGGGSIYLIGKFGQIVFKKESMGGGDVKFLAMIGSILGWEMAILIFFLAPFFGAIVGITAKLTRGAEVIPYGPYLSIATFIAIIWGKNILNYFFCF